MRYTVCSLIGIGAPLIVIYLMVGFALSIAWAETTPERSDESSFTNYIRWILFWPHFLIKRSETGARPEFWQLAREHPDIAYQWMLNDPETWLVVEPGSDKEAALAALGSAENGGDEERPIGLRKKLHRRRQPSPLERLSFMTRRPLPFPRTSLSAASRGCSWAWPWATLSA